MFFGQNLCEKRQIWVSEPHFGEVRGDAWPWLMARWKVHCHLSIHLKWISSLSVMVPELWGEMCTAWLISATICTQILPRQGGPQSTILGIRKLETLSYLTVKTTPRCVPSFWVNTNQSVTDRQTNGWICRRISLAKLWAMSSVESHIWTVTTVLDWLKNWMQLTGSHN